MAWLINGTTLRKYHCKFPFHFILVVSQETGLKYSRWVNILLDILVYGIVDFNSSFLFWKNTARLHSKIPNTTVIYASNWYQNKLGEKHPWKHSSKLVKFQWLVWYTHHYSRTSNQNTLAVLLFFLSISFGMFSYFQHCREVLNGSGWCGFAVNLHSTCGIAVVQH